MMHVKHRGVKAMNRPGANCTLENMENEVAKFARQCLHCANSEVGNMDPRPLDKVIAQRWESCYTLVN